MQASRGRLVLSPTFIAMVAVVLRLVGLYSLFRWRPWAVVDPVMSGGEVVQIARSIVWGKGFGNPIGGFETGPTAWICPVYPYIIAAIFKLEGIYTVRSRLVLLGLNCLFAGLTILPIYGIARRTFGRETAVIASWLWVVLPSAWQIPIRLMWDSALTALSLAVIVWATLAIRGQRRLLTWAGYGALWAFGALANAAILILAPFVFGWLLWDLRKQSASWFKPLAIAALIFALGLAPWTLRNYMVFGKVVLIRSNLGLVLWMAHHPGPPGFNGGMSPYSDRHQTALYQQMGEMEYMKAKKREAYSFMASHPGQTLSMAVGNAGTLWFGVTDRAANPWYGGARYLSIDFLANTAVILFALAGIVLALRARNTTAPLYLSIVLFFPLIYYLTRPALRFRFAFEPVLTVLAAYGAAQIFGCITQRRSNATVGSAVA